MTELERMRLRFCEAHLKNMGDAVFVRHCVICYMLEMRQSVEEVIRKRIRIETEDDMRKKELEEQIVGFKDALHEKERQNSELRDKIAKTQSDLAQIVEQGRKAIADAEERTELGRQLEKLNTDRIRLAIDLHKILIDLVGILDKYGPEGTYCTKCKTATRGEWICARCGVAKKVIVEAIRGGQR